MHCTSGSSCCCTSICSVQLDGSAETSQLKQPARERERERRVRGKEKRADREQLKEEWSDPRIGQMGNFESREISPLSPLSSLLSSPLLSLLGDGNLVQDISCKCLFQCILMAVVVTLCVWQVTNSLSVVKNETRKKNCLLISRKFDFLFL